MHTISTRSTNFLESTLAHFTTRDRASAMVGDLLEISESRSALWFYGSFVRILAATAWPRTTAWFGSYAMGVGLVWLAGNLWMHWRISEHKAHVDLRLNMNVWESCIALPLWFGAVYLLARYGLRDRMVQLTLILTMLLAASLLLEPFLAVKILCDVAALAVLATALCSAAWRSSILCLAVSGLIGFISFFSSIGIMAYLLHHRLFELDVQTREYVLLSAGIFALFAFTSACAYMHRSWVEGSDSHVELA